MRQFQYLEVLDFEGLVLFENCFLAGELPFELLVKFLKNAGVSPTGVVVFDDVAVIFKHFQLALQFLNISEQHLVLLPQLLALVLLVFEFKHDFFEQFRVVLVGLVDLSEVYFIAYPFQFSHPEVLLQLLALLEA